MSFPAFISSLVRAWYVVVACVVAGVLAAVGASARTTPAYTASSTVLVSAAGTEGQAALINLVPTYAQIATMNAVLGPAATELGYRGGAPALAQKVSAVAPAATSLVEVSAVDADPTRAAQVANAVTKHFGSYLATAPATRKQVSTTVVEVATPPVTPSSISRAKLLVTGGVLGLGLGTVLALVVGSLRGGRRGDHDAARSPAAPIEMSSWSRPADRPEYDGEHRENVG